MPARQVATLTTPEIRKLLATCDDELTACATVSCCLIGYAEALRLIELVASEHEHLSFIPDDR